MAKKQDLTGAERSKLQPKLQMIANGSSEVNAVRAEQCAGLRVTSQKLLTEVGVRRAAHDDIARARKKGGLKFLHSNAEPNAPDIILAFRTRAKSN
jgi:hypothetical protein